MSLKSQNVEAIQRNTVLRNVQTFIGKIPQKLIRLKNHVNDVENYSMITPVIPKDESIALTNVQTNPQLGRKLEFVHTVETHLPLILLHLIFVALGNAELQDRKLLIGHFLKRFFASVCNVVRNFGEDHLRLKDGLVVVNTALVLAKLILKELVTKLKQVFIVPMYGFRQEKELLKEINILANSVASKVKVFMSIIRNSKEMVGQKKMKISSHFVCDATCLNIEEWRFWKVVSLGLQVEPKVTHAACPS